MKVCTILLTGSETALGRARVQGMQEAQLQSRWPSTLQAPGRSVGDLRRGLLECLGPWYDCNAQSGKRALLFAPKLAAFG